MRTAKQAVWIASVSGWKRNSDLHSLHPAGSKCWIIEHLVCDQPRNLNLASGEFPIFS